jgi:hypothetical protein
MSAKRWVFLAVVLGFLGAAAFYSPYIGINGQTTIECPFCGHVTMSGSPVRHFVGLTILGGIVNAALLAAVGLLVGFLIKLTKRRPGSQSASS